MHPLASALEQYIALGWACTPLIDRIPCWSAYGDKPLESADDLPEHADGLGILPSLSGLVDIDADSFEMVQACAILMPATACYGHSGKVRHYLYRYSGDEPRFLNFHEGEFRAGVTSKDGHNRYSVLPPTPSKGGEATKWRNGVSKLATISTPDITSLYCRASLVAKLARLAKPHQRHQLHLELAGTLHRRGCSEEMLREIVSAVCSVSDDSDEADRQAAVTTTLERDASLRCLDAARIPDLGKILDQLSEIHRWQPRGGLDGAIRLTGVAAEDADKLATALLADPSLYARGGALTRVRVVDDHPIVEEHSRYSILYSLAAFAPTERNTKTGVKRMDPDEVTVKTLLSKPVHDVRGLEDVITTPMVRSDGTVLADPGYDAESRTLLIDTIARPLSSIEVGNTRKQGRAALAELLGLIKNFPLEEQGQTVWLALLLTLAARPLIRGPVPMFVFDAPSGGSGKSLLVQLAGLIATGRTPPSTASPSSADAGQLYFSVGSSAPPILFLDNCDRRSPETDALEQAVTSGMVGARKLHTQTHKQVPFRCVVVVSGNNVAFSDTFERRCLRARLGAIDLNAVRVFDQPQIRLEVEKNSPRFLGLVLTALSAYLSSRSRQDRSTLNLPPTRTLVSFEEWSALIPECLAWYGLPDIVAGAQAERTQAVGGRDDWRENAVGHLATWASKLPAEAGGEFRARALWAKVSDSGGGFGQSARELREALEAALGRELRTAVDCGRALSRLRDVPTGNAKAPRILRARIDGDGVAWWRVEGAAMVVGRDARAVG